MPRLGRFMEKYPHIAVNVHASLALVSFARDEVDVAVRFGRGGWPNVHAEKLMGDERFPVASPRFNRGRLPRRPANLAQYRLLRTDDEPWVPWFKAAGVQFPEPKGPIFNDAALMVHAAIDGRGIALARRSIVEDALAAGDLVRLFDIAIQTEESYYLVCPEGNPPDKVLAFREWILAETKRKD